jgi:hypothetical protein
LEQQFFSWPGSRGVFRWPLHREKAAVYRVVTLGVLRGSEAVPLVNRRGQLALSPTEELGVRISRTEARDEAALFMAKSLTQPP